MLSLTDKAKHEIVKITLAVGLANMAVGLVGEIYKHNKDEIGRFIENAQSKAVPAHTDVLRISR